MQTNVLPYEVLFRWRDGVLCGAHKQMLVRTVDADGNLLAESVTPAQPLAVEDLEAVYPAADAAADNSRLLALVREKDAEISRWRDEAQIAKQEVDRLVEIIARVKE